jgi:hypothetical protein
LAVERADFTQVECCPRYPLLQEGNHLGTLGCQNGDFHASGIEHRSKLFALMAETEVKFVGAQRVGDLGTGEPQNIVKGKDTRRHCPEQMLTHIGIKVVVNVMVELGGKSVAKMAHAQRA